MTNTTLVFASNVPQEVHARLRRQLKPFMGLLERQIRVLHVEFATPSEEMDGTAATLAMRRYHWSTIFLTPKFFELPEEEQARTLAHEVVHVVHDIFAREVAHLVVHLVPEEIREYVSWRLEDAEERVVDALGDAIWEAQNT